MKRFRFTLSWDSSSTFVSRDKAKTDLQDIWEEIEQLDRSTSPRDTKPTLVTFDVQELPQEAGGHISERLSMVEDLASQVPHPWDQGLSIFPDDHPLAPYERLARGNQTIRGRSEEREKEKAVFLEVGRKLELLP